MIKTLIQRCFNACGYRISRIPRSQPASSSGQQYDVDADERATLMRELEAFAAANPGRGLWSEPRRARDYLSDKRLHFYHDVLDLCGRHGVTWADGCNVADVGSGPGYLLRLISERAPETRLTGFDTHADITELARWLCPSARFVVQDLFDIVGEQFDLIFNTEMLEHLMRPDLALRQLLGLLRDGGTLVLSVPNGRTDSLEAGGRLDNGRGYWGHINFWSPESWEIFVNLHAVGADTSFGRMPTGENYAVVRMPRRQATRAPAPVTG